MDEIDFNGVKTSELMEAAFSLRQQLEEFEERCKPTIEGIKSKLSAINGEILRRFNEEDISSLKGERGTVSKVVTTKYSIADPESFYDFVIREGAVQLFPRSVIKSEVENFYKERGELPVGLAPHSELSLRFTKAKG